MLIRDVGFVPVGETHRALSPNILDLAWGRCGGGTSDPRFMVMSVRFRLVPQLPAHQRPH